jgi:EmrB/QacA subfamily drug resistance transporter
VLDRSPEAVHARRWTILGVLCLSLVLVVIGNVALNIALPSLGHDLGASFTAQQWMVDAYSLVFAGLLLPAGALGDRYGRKGALQGGLVVFGAASLLAAFAPGAGVVILARAVMGAAAAFVMPGTLSILAAVFPPEERHRAIAVWAGFAGASVTLGMLLSGWLLEHFWWGSVFLANVVVVAAALALGALLLPTSRDPEQAALDVTGGVLSMVAFAVLLYAIIEAPTHGWLSSTTLVGAVVAAVLLAAFLRWERRTDEPMLDLGYFTDRRFLIVCVTISVAFFGLFGVYFLLTQYLQLVRGYAPLAAGVRTVPAGVTQMIAAPASARLVERWGARTVMAGGLALLGAGMLVLAALGPATPGWVLLVGLSVLGFGIGLATPPATGIIIASLPIRKAGVGSAVNDTTRELGGALGIAVLGSIAASGFRGGIAGALRGVPAGAADAARRGIGGAVEVGQRLHGDAGARLLDAARSSYSSGLHAAMLTGGLLTLAGAVAVRRALPRRALVELQDERETRVA